MYENEWTWSLQIKILKHNIQQSQDIMYYEYTKNIFRIYEDYIKIIK